MAQSTWRCGLKFPWSRKPEVRESDSYADQRLRVAVSTAAGVSHVGDVQSTAALEAVCRLYQSVFSVAKVTSSNTAVRDGLSSTWLASAVRAMLRGGESVHSITSDSGRLAFLPCAQVDITGGPRPSTWTYRLTQDGPTQTSMVTLTADSVLHLRWSYDPARPWVGVGPMEAASMTSRLVGGLELRQAEEGAAVVGAILPMARGPGRS